MTKLLMHIVKTESKSQVQASLNLNGPILFVLMYTSASFVSMTVWTMDLRKSPQNLRGVFYHVVSPQYAPKDPNFRSIML